MRICLRNTKKGKYWEIETLDNEQVIRTSGLNSAWGLDGFYKTKYKKFADADKAAADSQKKIAAACKKGFEEFEPEGKVKTPTSVSMNDTCSNDVFLFRRIAEAGVAIDEKVLCALARDKSLDVLKDFHQRSIAPPPPALVDATQGNAHAVVAWLLDMGVAPDSVGRYGWTPLMMAAQKAGSKTVALLLEAGANANASGEDGSTPLMHTVLSGKIDKVKMVLAAGADLTPTSATGNSALALALRELRGARLNARDRWLEICELLLESGAPVGALGADLEAQGIEAPASAGPAPAGSAGADERMRPKVIGGWRAVKMRYYDSLDGDPDFEGPEDYNFGDEEDPCTLELHDDGTVTYTHDGDSETGDWRIHRDEIAMLDSKDPIRVKVRKGAKKLALHDYDDEHGANFDIIFVRA